jgi:N-acetylglutamate synthase
MPLHQTPYYPWCGWRGIFEKNTMYFDIETIERSTIAAVSPESVHELPGWLLPFDRSTVGRAKSAVPLVHTTSNASAALVHTIEQLYAERGLQAHFRLPDVPSFDAMRQALSNKGYRAEQPTLVQCSCVAAMRKVTQLAPAQVSNTPDAGWASVFLGEGFDPVDGASRVKILTKAPGSVFASVREGDHTIAAGAGAFSYGWASVHGMRTAAAHRGQGLAGRVLAGLADTAMQRGIDRVFLQVEEGNAAANALYLRAGFTSVWKYVYWRLPPQPGEPAVGC